MILEVVNQVGVPEVQELVVENSRKEFNITTDVNEIDGIKGGSISGEDMTSYEKVLYGENSTESIVMTPEEGYEIIGITVNGEEWKFEENPDGTYTMPQFENVTEDKHIVVTYSLKDNKIIINKVDSEDNSKKLSGATFKLDQLEERTDPNNEEIIGEIVANGQEYVSADTEKGEVTGVLGELTDNGTYYFVENEDGTLTPTNSKTYQTANGGTAGVGNTTANSYIPIDLSSKSGEYVVVVNARVSSQSSSDYGYATVNQSTTAPTYSTSTGRFMYISGTSSSVTTAKDYTSSALQGGQTYYLHLGYRKSSSTDTGEDQVVINSIKVYEKKGLTYNFIDNGSGGYESNNQGKDSTVANSYIPIDLSNYSGKYNLTVNAKVSSASGDYGYATVTSSETAPTYSTSTGRFIYISGEVEAEDYTTELQGGQMYYLHLGYYKNSSTSTGDDKFTVNSIKITNSSSELYHTEVTTNMDGQAITQLPFGKYQITEVVAPEGYELNSEPTVVEFREDGNHEFTIENNKQAQVIVHHYLKNNDGTYTTTSVAEDELVEGKNGEKYTTSPKLDLTDYELEKNESGEYVIPENATGTFTPGVTEVIYYYEEKEIPLTVHHYIEGTEEKVPLKDDGVAEDVTDSGKEGEEYHTSAIDDSLLSDDYELVETPENSTGTYSGEEVVVTYYYNRVERDVVINKYSEDGRKQLAGVDCEIQKKEDKEKEKTIGKVSNVKANGEYYFVKDGEKLISNNQNKNSTTANSYIKIDLSNKETATLTINAEISSQSSDYGYVIVNDNISNPSYSTTTGRIFRISGQVEAKDYEMELEGGKVYYLHIGYYKNGSTSSYDDTFTINSITIDDVNILNLEKIEKTTNENGQIELTLKSGEYVATEVETLSGYDIPSNNETNFSVRKQDDVITLNITNIRTKGTVITHYYIEGTKTQVPSNSGTVVEDVVQTGNVGDIYATKEAENVASNYEFVSTEGQTSGTIVEGTTEVIYYYKLKDPSITSEITKESSIEKITDVNQIVDYTMNYKGVIDNYKGNAEVKIVDYLPYEIDESKAYELAGGEYNKESKTITWTEEIADIDTFTNGAYNVDITKEISLVYKDIDVTKDSISNKVTGTIKLETPEKEDTKETTKEIPAEYLVSFPVTKHWLYGNVARPRELTIIVKNGNKEVARKTIINEEYFQDDVWETEITGLPKYDESGNEINYTVDEEYSSSGPGSFNKEITGNMKEGFVITNTYDTALNLIRIKKVWNDDNTPEQISKRPKSIQVTISPLYGGEGTSETVTLTAPNWEEEVYVQQFTIDAVQIEYSVKEVNIENKFYKNTSIEGDMFSGYTITNTFQVPDEKVDIPVTKVWNDNGNASGKRPESVELVLTGTGANVNSTNTATLTAENNTDGNTNTWEYTFTGLPKYDSNGDEIQYTVTEKEVNSEDLKFYTNNVSGDMKSGYTITNTFIVPDETVDIPVTKVWNDNENALGRRPESVELVLTGTGANVNTTNTATLTAENDTDGNTNTWEYTFTGLKKYDDNGDEIQYTVTEKEVNSDDLKFYTNNVSGNMESGYTITNTFTVPGDTTSIIANKVWNDNQEQSVRRPSSVTLVVKNGDKEVQSKVVNNSNLVAGTTNQWSVEFEGLPKYDSSGKEITYTVEERETTEGDLHFYKAEENNVIVEDGQATIRNNFVKPDDTISVTVRKEWKDEENVNGRRPNSIKLQVKNGESVVSEQVVTETEGWSHTFTDLPKYDANGKEIVYTASEAEVNSGDLKFYTSSGVSGDMASGYTIENTFTVPDEKIELTVNKVWQDNDIQAQRRPSVVVINVLGEDGSVVATHDLNTATETSHTFTDLPKYNSKGQEINYTVQEQEKKAGDLYFYTGVVGNVENTSENSKKVTITNTFKKPEEKTDVLVTKIWEDNNNEAGKRPESIKLLLKNGSETVGEQEVNSSNAVSGNANSWEYTFTGVEKYNENGQEIKYTVDEQEVNSGDLQFYNKNLSGLTVTNTFTQDTTKVNVPVTKVWVDNEEQSSRRPESVMIVLKANGAEKERYELSGSGDTWNYTFEGLPKYDEHNNIINYTVEELEVNKGDLKFYNSTVDGTTITNTFRRPSDVISIEVTKNWEDQENVYGKRPVSVRVNVKNGEEVVQTEIVTKDNLWKHTFTNLPKYDENGREIVYTLSEEEVMANDLFYYTGEVGNITNVSGNEFEATITNNMTKIPGKVIVKYVDKATGEEISEEKTKEGIVGETFDVTEDVKEIPGYTLVEEPEEKTGTYTVKTQEKIYYYAKNTSVLVKYLEKDNTPEDDSDNKVLSEEILLGGYEGESYSTNSKVIDGYTLVETKGNLNGTMTAEQQVVVYYYSKDTKVIVKYLRKDDTPNITTDNEVLSPQEEILGYVGENYTTTEKLIPGYTLVEKTTNYQGQMTEEVIEVIYYYAKNTNVVVKYLEKDTNVELEDEVLIEGYEGKDYETEQKEIENYTFVEDTGNTSGKMEEGQIEVIYYYAQNTKAKVEHIDRETGEILKEETKDGKVGDLFETHPEDFDGYILVESPEEPNIIMDKTGEQVVRYYYAHISAGVIEKHIDIITGELLDSSEHKGNEGDEYNIPSKEFPGYDLVEQDDEGNNMLPENASGTMKRDEVIEVKYYYIKKASVVVKYVDEKTGEEIAERVVIEGHENDPYDTEAKDIDGYELSKTPENKSGTMTITKNEDGTYDTEIEVIYYYKKQAGGVIENHIDIDTGKELATEKHEGYVGDPYDIPERQFEGYDLVTDKLPDNSKGTMTEEEIVVNYYYKKKAKVIVEYIDKLTGEKIIEDVSINGHIGDEYSSEEKVFDGYDLVEKPVNGKGEMTEDEIVVKYYYQRKAEVEVKYLEKGTDYEVSEGSLINGYVGDDYETEQKDIPYYKFVEKTENWKGTMTKEKITVIYYYEKEIFNLGVDKWVESVNINGISSPAQSINNSDEIYKVDIHRSKADTAEIKVTYKIRITNKGEIEGTVGKITDIIPSGYTFNQEDNDIYWENNNGVLSTDDLNNETIKPGEYKEIEVVLRASGSSEKYGQKDNMVILTELNNPAGYEDVDKEDNSDTSSMIITIATGLDRNDRIVIIGIVQIVLAITIGLLLSYKKKE